MPELSTAIVANDGWLPLTSDQVEIVPSSVAKINCAGLPETWKSSGTGLNAMPVGVAGEFDGVGMPIPIGSCGVPVGSKTLARPLLLAAIQKGWFGLNAMPHGLMSPGSVWVAMSVSDTRLVC